jgi:hypothetical protein
MADQYTPRPPKQGAVSGSGGGHLVRTPPLPPASPSDELLSGELPDHVNAEQEAGRKAVASARNQTMAEQEAGRKAMEQSRARGGRPPPRGSEPAEPSRPNPLHGNQE